MAVRDLPKVETRVRFPLPAPITKAMSSQEPVQIGDPIIRTRLKKVQRPTSKQVKDTINKLVASMRHNGLIGMAANQIGVNLQVFVTEIRPTKHRNAKDASELRIYINPRITALSNNKSILYEGCGSLINGAIFGPVRRPSTVTVKALDETGKEFTLNAKGLLAKCIQHEYDHLQGIVCIDKFTDTRKVIDRPHYLKNRKIK